MIRKILFFCLLVIIFCVQVQAKEKPKIKLNDESLNLSDQMKELKKDIHKAKRGLKSIDNENIENIDIVIEGYVKTISMLEKQINDYTNTKNTDQLEAAAFTLDLLIQLVSETNATIPNKQTLSMASVNFKEFSPEYEAVMQEIMKDINKAKIIDQKNFLFGVQQLESLDYNLKDLLKNLNEKELGLQDLDELLEDLNIEKLDIQNIDIASINSTFEQLEQLDIQNVTESVAETIEQTSQAIEQVTEEVVEVLWEDYFTVSEILGFLNNELNTNVTLYEFNASMGYLYNNVDTGWNLWGGSSGYQGQNSWGDAVNDYNAKFGTNYTADEALGMSADIICFYKSAC